MNNTSTHDLLRAFLRDREASCPACGYALRNCQSDRCPECGAKIQLSIGEAGGEVSRMWVFAVSGWFVTALISVVVLIGYIRILPLLLPGAAPFVGMGFGAPGLPDVWFPVFLLSVISTLTIGVTIWLFSARRRIHAWPRTRQSLAALGGILAPLMLLTFFYVISLLVV